MTDHTKTAGVRLLNGQILGGLFTAVLSTIAWISARVLDFGSLAEIGPGLFPVVLAVLLLLLSLCLLGLGFLKTAANFDVPDATMARSVFAIIGALVAFAITIKGGAYLPALGVTGATPLAILIAGFASSETRWRDLILFAIALTACCAFLFRFLLGLPLPLAPWILGY
jgi:hypothetical protein